MATTKRQTVEMANIHVYEPGYEVPSNTTTRPQSDAYDDVHDAGTNNYEALQKPTNEDVYAKLDDSKKPGKRIEYRRLALYGFLSLSVLLNVVLVVAFIVATSEYCACHCRNQGENDTFNGMRSEMTQYSGISTETSVPTANFMTKSETTASEVTTLKMTTTSELAVTSETNTTPELALSSEMTTTSEQITSPEWATSTELTPSSEPTTTSEPTIMPESSTSFMYEQTPTSVPTMTSELTTTSESVLTAGMTATSVTTTQGPSPWGRRKKRK
ncbi:protein PRY2 isoform X2 [Lingula anatina]|uniref:Protein PRY2 isoform X2 n=1 Tax=Lingula anatina TaxID=7574 RepID=A0A1S3IVI7_LINAN|nr:protein PRY2 isoform X2 [Lingula anatina]|eukprot:XP_013402205.1 protein PRY2 isoform X2 [Lingula anatina]